MKTPHAIRATVVAVLAAAVPLVATPAFAQTTLRISSAGAESDFLTTGLKVFKEQVEKALPGQVTVQIHPASSLFRQGTEVPAMQRGNLEMSTMTTFEVEQQVPEYSLFSTGYLFRDYDHMAKVMRGPIGEEYAKTVAAKMGLQIVEMMYLGTRQVNLRQNKPVKVPADLAGVKLRMPGGPGWLALGRGLGAAPTPMAMPEVYLAMKTGSIDGQENPLSLTKANNLHEVSQAIVLTSHMVQPVFLTMAKPVWDKFSPAQQAAIRTAARAGAEANDKGRLEDEKSVASFFREKGLTVTMPDLAAFRASVAKAYAAADLAKVWPAGLKERIEAVK